MHNVGALCPEPIESIFKLGGGANSRVFGIHTVSGKRYVLKRYPGNDLRGRRKAEAAALTFMMRQRVGCIPRLVATDAAHNQSLITWVSGKRTEIPDNDDVCQFLDFQIRLDQIADDEAHTSIGNAAEACISGSRILDNIVQRLDRLRVVKAKTPGFAAFFDDGLEQALPAFEARARRAYRDLGRDFDDDLPVDEQTLIVSDFGTHNALKAADGQLTFIDFEYFGWDDPLTSIANFVLHPGMRLTSEQKSIYSDGLFAHFDDGILKARFDALQPLHALRWCTIILGELLPEKWEQRLQSNPEFGDWDKIKQTQLDKAHALLACFQ